MKRKKRLAALACGGLVLIVAALCTRHFWFNRPLGDGPAGPTVDAGFSCWK